MCVARRPASALRLPCLLAATHQFDEFAQVGARGQCGRHGGEQFAAQGRHAHGAAHHVAALQVRQGSPARQHGNAALARHQLHDGGGEFGAAARRGAHPGGKEQLVHHIELVVRHRVGDEGLGGEVGGLQRGLGGAWMVTRQQRDEVEAEQRQHDQRGRRRRRFVQHRQVGAAVEHRQQGVGKKAREQIHFHVRPARAQRVHRRHQPVETAVAFHRDAQAAALPLAQLRQRPLGVAHARQHVGGEIQQTLAGGCEAHRGLGALEQALGVMLLQHRNLPRQRRLRQVHALRSAGEAAGFSQGLQRGEMPQVEWAHDENA